MLEEFRKLIEDAGGYVNPKLQLLVGDEAEHGLVSLAGVPDDELSLRVPYSLAEDAGNPGPWLALLVSLGYDIFHPYFSRAHNLGDGYYPLLGAANHRYTNEPGGFLTSLNGGYELRVCTFTCTEATKYLHEVWRKLNE